MAHKQSRLRWYRNNKIDLLQNGGQFFPALCAAIDAAQVSVHLETYIFNLDQTGTKVLSHLRQACQRGVKVRVMIDGFGSMRDVDQIVAALEAMGAQSRVYRPEPTGIRRYKFSLSRLRRLHRKVTVVDSRIAFVGGINIIDDLQGVPNEGLQAKPRFDFTVSVQGPIVLGLDKAQTDLWVRMAWRHRNDWAAFYQRIKGWRQRRAWAKSKNIASFEPGLRAALLLRDNIRYRQVIENVYLYAIEQAEHDILIANSYFFPGRRLRFALKHAATRGVRVRLMLQGHAEYVMQYRACRSMYGQLLDNGIEIYEYMASYLHAKVAVVDSCAMVGSSNLDPFSLLLAREANIFIDDAGFAGQLTMALETELTRNCQRITQKSQQKSSFIVRWIDAASYFLLRMGIALTGKSSQF